ncbi:MAG: radical SAM protein, partial [Alphaproteobacteria bacterium]
MGVEVVTFGCRLNTLESEVMGRLARESGLEDAVIFNTCAVTSEATRQARQSIRRIKRERPDARIVVTGCAAQTEAKTFAGMAEVDRVIGNDEKMRASGWTATRQALTEPADSTQNAEAKLALSDIMTVRDQGLHQIDRMAGRTRAFVQVQNGCDHRCTFCIIPYGRGNSRSVPIAEVVAQVRALVDTGHREVVLTGVDLTSYGEHLPGEPRLGALVKAILRAVPDLE